MIIKTKLGATFKGCINYVLGKEDAQILKANHVSDELSRHIIQDFELIRSMRPRVKNAVWHTSVSFAHQDKVTDDLMLSIASDYLKQMKLDSNQYIVVKHNDTKHKHFHIVSNRVGLDGSLVNDSWCKNRSAQVSDRLEVKYNLTIATHQRRNSLNQDAESLKGFSKTKKDVKELIKVSIYNCLNESISNLEELADALLVKGIEMIVQKRIDGTVNGVSFRTHKLAFKGSAIHKDFRAKSLLKILETQSQKLRNGLRL